MIYHTHTLTPIGGVPVPERCPVLVLTLGQVDGLLRDREVYRHRYSFHSYMYCRGVRAMSCDAIESLAKTLKIKSLAGELPNVRKL
jgi:hypothetical protein